MDQDRQHRQLDLVGLDLLPEVLGRPADHQAGEQVADGVDVLPGPLVVGDPRDRTGEVGDGVVVVRDRPVAGRPPGPQGEPGDPLLGGLEQVGPLVTTGGQVVLVDRGFVMRPASQDFPKVFPAPPAGEAPPPRAAPTGRSTP